MTTSEFATSCGPDGRPGRTIVRIGRGELVVENGGKPLRIPAPRIHTVNVGRSIEPGVMELFDAEGTSLAQVFFRRADAGMLLALEDAVRGLRFRREGGATAKGARIELEKTDLDAGEPIRGRLIVELPDKKKVRGIRLVCEGYEETSITVTRGSGEDSYTETYREVRELVRSKQTPVGSSEAVGTWQGIKDGLAALSGKLEGYPELGPGLYVYDFQFDLMRDALPSYKADFADVWYRVYAEIDIAAGFDLTAQENFYVNPWPGRVAPQAYALSRRTRGMRTVASKGFEIALELQEGAFVSGGSLLGIVTIHNAHGKTIKGVRFAVVQNDRATAGGFSRTGTKTLAGGELAVDAPQAEVNRIPFGIPLPPEVVFLDGRYLDVWVTLKIEVVVAWATNPELEVDLGVTRA